MALKVPFFWQSPGTMLVSPSGAKEVVQTLLSRGYDIHGLEGFELESTTTLPRIDRIFDSKCSPGDALSALSGWEDNVWVHVTLGKPALS